MSSLSKKEKKYFEYKKICDNIKTKNCDEIDYQLDIQSLQELWKTYVEYQKQFKLCADKRIEYTKKYIPLEKRDEAHENFINNMIDKYQTCSQISQKIYEELEKRKKSLEKQQISQEIQEELNDIDYIQENITEIEKQRKSSTNIEDIDTIIEDFEKNKEKLEEYQNEINDLLSCIRNAIGLSMLLPTLLKISNEINKLNIQVLRSVYSLNPELLQEFKNFRKIKKQINEEVFQILNSLGIKSKNLNDVNIADYIIRHYNLKPEKIEEFLEKLEQEYIKILKKYKIMSEDNNIDLEKYKKMYEKIFPLITPYDFKLAKIQFETIDDFVQFLYSFQSIVKKYNNYEDILTLQGQI